MTALAGAESIGRVVGRSPSRPADLVVLDPPALGPGAPPRRIQPARLAGDWTIEALVDGENGSFVVVRVHELGTRIEACNVVSPAAVLGSISVDTRGNVHEDHFDLPLLVPVSPIGDTVQSLIQSGGDAPARVLHLPPSSAFAHLTAGVEEYGLSTAVLPGSGSVAIQSAHGHGRFAVWDATAGRLVAEVDVNAWARVLFASALFPRDTLWAATDDTLLEFDPKSWVVRSATRLGAGTGCFVGWLRSIDAGRTVLIGLQRRAPAAGDVLALDTQSGTVQRLARLPAWTEDAVLRRTHGDLVVETWADGHEFWQAPLQPEPYPSSRTEGA